MHYKNILVPALVGMTMAAHADVTSDFETGTDGWLTVNVAFPTLTVLGTHTPTWTGHTITDTEFQGNGLLVIAAPAKYTGDLSSYYGGTVSYQLSDAISDGVAYPNLLLRGNGTVLYYTTAAPATTLTPYSISLKPTGWLTGLGTTPTESEFKAVLSNLDVFAINADWKTAGMDSYELDNVVVHAVPEPASMVALGMGALALFRRRR